MRDYGKVYTVFWTSEDVLNMSEDERTLALYLLTCPHGNMLGCFRLTNAYASDDLKWTSERVSKAFKGLTAKGYIYRCERSFWLVIKRYLKWNQFENPNVGKAAGKLFVTLAPPNDVKALLAAALREFSPTFPVAILSKFEAENKPFGNPSELNPETGAVAVAVAVTRAVAGTTATANPLVEQKPLDPDQVQTIFEFWQKIMVSPRAVLDAKRKTLIANALKSYSPTDICKAIRGCSKSLHHMGQNDRNTKYNGLDLILRSADHIERFIGFDDGNARAGAETIEQKNARLTAEFMSDAKSYDDSVIEMET